MRAVNLIPSDSRPGSAPGAGRSGGVAYAVLAVLGGLAILALLYGMAHHQISSRRAQAASLSARAQRAQAEAARLAPYTSFASLREQRTQAVSDLVDARFDWAHAFHELGRVLPSDASISSLTGTVGSSTGATSSTASAPAASSATSSSAAAARSTATSATPPGSAPVFSLSGCATSQSEVALTLARLRLIDGVSEVTLQSSTKSGTTGSAGGASGSGGCEPSQPAFTVQVTFDPLPSSSAITSARTKLTSQAGAGR
jgi:Tfp pilus assembly protein PilN